MVPLSVHTSESNTEISKARCETCAFMKEYANGLLCVKYNCMVGAALSNENMCGFDRKDYFGPDNC